MYAGVCVVSYGFAVCALVIVLLLVARHRSVDTTPASRRRGSAVVLAVLLLNFPAYGVAMVVAAWRFARFTIELVNEGDAAWQDLVVDGGGVHVDVAAIGAAKTHSLHVWFQHDGRLLLHHGAAPPIVVEGYVTNGWGGSATVVRQHDGTVIVRASRDR
jgi:hypothetical protein